MIILCGKTFETKKAAQEFVRAHINQFDPNHPLWLELLQNHPEAATKIGVGVSGFKIQQHPMSGHPYLVVTRLDGSSIDFSWRSCIDGVGKTKGENLRAAMRNAIKDQVVAFRNSAEKICSLCGVGLEAKSHVDHVVPFETMVRYFLTKKTELVPTEFDDCSESNRAKFREQDSGFCNRWLEFHSTQATLRLLCPKCNLGRNRKSQSK